MSVADIAVVSIVVLAGLTAFSLGFVRVILALLGWVGAAFTTLYAFNFVQPFAQKWIAVGFLADSAAALSIFLVTLIVLTIVSHAIGQRIRDSRLSALDRSVGLVFGLGFGAILVSLTYLCLAWAIDIPTDTAKQPSWIKESKFRPVVQWGSYKLQMMAPASWIVKTKMNGGEPEQSLRRFEKLIEPETKSSTSPQRQGYSSKERKEMDRLIKGQR